MIRLQCLLARARWHSMRLLSMSVYASLSIQQLGRYFIFTVSAPTNLPPTSGKVSSAQRCYGDSTSSPYPLMSLGTYLAYSKIQSQTPDGSTLRRDRVKPYSGGTPTTSSGGRGSFSSSWGTTRILPRTILRH